VDQLIGAGQKRHAVLCREFQDELYATRSGNTQLVRCPNRVVFLGSVFIRYIQNDAKYSNYFVSFSTEKVFIRSCTFKRGYGNDFS